MSDEQDVAEALDSDKVVDDLVDGELEPDYPPEELQGADEYGVTPAEEEIEEPIAERAAREEPDPLREEPQGRRAPGGERVGREPAGGVGGRLVDVAGGDSSVLDAEDRAVADVETADDRDLTAEEAAMHEEPGTA